MDPHIYCQEAIAELRVTPDDKSRFGPVGKPQLIIVLAHFARRDAPGDEFERDLAGLARGAKLQHRESLAAAAKAILHDWRAAEREQRAASLRHDVPA